MRTRITELLGIRFPILQGGMAWVADARLAAAVSNGGGVGIIAGGNAPPEIIRDEIRKVRQLTRRPFGVNIMMMSEYAEELAELMVEERVPVVTTGAGNPGKLIPVWKEAGIKVIPVVPTVALAKRLERAGADALIAEGCEAGGHIGELTTMALVPQVVDAVSIPVIAAGGIADGRGIAAALMLGAEGVQVGTRFLVAKECHIHPNYKAMVLRAKDTDTAVTGRKTGHPVRQIRNKFTKNVLALEKANADPKEFEEFTVGSLKKAVMYGDTEHGSFMAGQIAGMIDRIQPAAEIILEMFSQAELWISATGKIISENGGDFIG